MRTIRFISTIILLIQVFCVSGQTEYIASVNNETGTFNKIDSIHNVRWIYENATAFDENGKRYILYGMNPAGDRFLWSVNVLTGENLTEAAAILNLGEFHYDNELDVLYCLYLENALGEMYVASLDISTCIPTVVDTLPFMGYGGGTSFYDEVNHVFYIQNADSLYGMNVVSGSLTATYTPQSFNQLEFDNSTETPYGLIMGTPMILVSFDVTDGTYIIIDTLPTTGYSSAIRPFDEINHFYVLYSNDQLFSIDVTLGEIIYDPVFPVLSDPLDNVIELHFDNSTGILYGLHWDNYTFSVEIESSINANNEFCIYPNPFSLDAKIELNKNYNEATIIIHNAAGQILKNEFFINNSQLSINSEELLSGVYYVSIICDKKYIGTEKIVIQ